MAETLRIYSFLFAAAAIVLVVAVTLWRARQFPTWLRVIGVPMLLIGVLLIWSGIRPAPSQAITSLAQAESFIGNGSPTIIQFYSDFCIGCMAIENDVQALEIQLNNRADILRVSIHTDVGRELGQRYDFEYSPWFIVFDAEGVLIWRGSSVPDYDRLFPTSSPF